MVQLSDGVIAKLQNGPACKIKEKPGEEKTNERKCRGGDAEALIGNGSFLGIQFRGQAFGAQQPGFEQGHALAAEEVAARWTAANSLAPGMI